MRIYLETFGCQMNNLDSELICAQLSSNGYELINELENANVVLFNTCSVRDLSEQKILSRLGVLKKYKENGKKFIIGILGCMAERAGVNIFEKNPHVNLLVGPSRLSELSDILKKIQNGKISREIALSNFRNRKGKNSDFEIMDSLEALDSVRLSNVKILNNQSYVRITRGCDKFCSFCVVPKTRGPETHRNPGSILKEIELLVDKGAVQITLLGQTINHYPGFAKLLKQIHDQNPTLKRIRFLTNYPRDFDDEMLDVMKESDRICKYLHIPAQSGSNEILKRMNRGYTREMYLDLIYRARKRMPNINFAGDMIVGFPGETDEDFKKSLTLIEEVDYANVFIFKYSPRPGTISDKFNDDISIKVKKERNRAMLELQNKIALNKHNGFIGKDVEILVEGRAKFSPISDQNQIKSTQIKSTQNVTRMIGRTDGDQIVAFDGLDSMVGKFITVTIKSATVLSLQGIQV